MVITRSMPPPEGEVQCGDEAEVSDLSSSPVKTIGSAAHQTSGIISPMVVTHPTPEVPLATRMTLDADDGSSDEAPEVEEASEARAREEKRVAADVALQAERKEARRALSKAREATAIARKKKQSKRELLRKERAEGASADILPQHVLDSAVEAAERHERSFNHATQKESMRSQSGVLRIFQKELTVDGLEVVDASLSADQRSISRKPRQSKKAKTPAAEALNFLHKSLYGFEHHRISSIRGATKRKSTNLISDKASKRAESSLLLTRGVRKGRKS